MYCVNMNFFKTIGELNLAIHKKDSNTIREILSNNPGLLKFHVHHFPLMNALLKGNNEEIIESEPVLTSKTL